MRQVLLILTLISTLTWGGGGSPIRATPTPQTQTEALGYCSETAPTVSTRIARATVTIVDGLNAGQSVTSDANGVFQFAPL